MRNYDITKLQILSDVGGFVLGQSRLGVDVLTSNPWQDMTAGFASITIDRAVDIENGILIHPQAGTLTLTTQNTDWLNNGIGRNIRIAYDNKVICQMVITDAQLSSTIDRNLPDNQVTVTCTDAVGMLNSYSYSKWAELSASSTLSKIASDTKTLFGGSTAFNNSKIKTEIGYDAQAHVSNDPVTALQLITDVADAELLAAYSNPSGQVILLDGAGLNSTQIALADDPTGLVGTTSSKVGLNLGRAKAAGSSVYAAAASYSEVDFSVAQDFLVTALNVTSVAQMNDSPAGSATVKMANQGANNTEDIEVYVLASDIGPWANLAPLFSVNTQQPSSVTVPFNEAVVVTHALDLMTLVDTYQDSQIYSSVVTGVNHTITTENWISQYDLMPAEVVTAKGKASQIPPPPTKLVVTANVARDEDDDVFAEFSFKQAPQSEKYVVRVAKGSKVPPLNATKGTFIGNLGSNANSFTLQSLAQNTQYAVSIFSQKGDLYSSPATVTFQTGKL